MNPRLWLMMFGSRGALIQRYITSLSAAGGMFYQLSDPVVIGNGDFEIESYVATTATVTQSILGCSTDLKFKIVLISGAVWVLVGDGAVWQKQINSGVNIADGSFHVVGFRKVSSDYHVIVDGVIVASSTDADPVSVEIDRIAFSNSSYLSGELYDAMLWTGGDRTTGTLLHIPIDEDWTTLTDLHDAQGNVVGSAINITEDEAELYVRIDDGANWLGEEFWDYGRISNFIVSSSYSDHTGTYAKNPPFLAATYLVSVSTHNLLTDGAIRVYAGNASIYLYQADVSKTDVLKPTGSFSKMTLGSASGTYWTADEVDISIKRIIPIAGGA